MNAWQIWLALSMAAFGMIGLTLPLKKAVSVTTSKFVHSKVTGLDGAGMKSGLACSPPKSLRGLLLLTCDGYRAPN
jgi:hypothetical protein